MNALDAIRRISNITPICIHDKDKNPYRILTEENGMKCAYIFTVPIYSLGKHRLLDQHWSEKNMYWGINSKITNKAGEAILENNIDRAEITSITDYGVKPSSNGITLTSDNGEIHFELRTEHSYPIRENGTSFALMAAKHLPFMTVTPFLAESENGMHITSFIEAIDKGDRKYAMRIYTLEPNKKITVEINLYMPKFIFDTTIESAYPDKNNVYGNYALIGNSSNNGEQRLLFRLNNSKSAISGLGDIKKADIYIPKFGEMTGELCAYKITNPWCTFNTNWVTTPDIKKSGSRFTDYCDYIKADITEMIKNTKNYGMMLKNDSSNGYTAVSTADSYDHPMIIKIQYT